MAIFGTFHRKLGNMWPREYIADNGKAFYLRRRTKQQLVFIAADTLHHADGEKNNAVVEYSATAQTDADGNEYCTIECAGAPLHLDANKCHLGGSTLTWRERNKIIDDITG
jgi:hypothetical protein